MSLLMFLQISPLEQFNICEFVASWALVHQKRQEEELSESWRLPPSRLRPFSGKDWLTDPFLSTHSLIAMLSHFISFQILCQVL